MSAVPKMADKKSLKNLVPLNGLSATHFEELAKKASVLALKPGKYLFKKGERDNSTCYVLEGEIALVDGSDIKLTIEGGTEEAKHPIAPQQPRQLGARAKTHCTIISIDSGLLDVMLAWEQTASYEVDNIESDDEDWMSRLMQSELLQRLPATNLQQLFMRMQEVDARAGEVIVRQDDEGDYYYIIKNGTSIVSRKPSANAREVKLAELNDGDSFGEESLLSGAKRNASVTMLTNGKLMRLSKQDFNELLKAPLLSQISYAESMELVEKGAAFLDVRLPGEYGNAHLKDSVNIPLAAIRNELTSIDNDREYIVYCDTGRRSTSAVFLLGQFGIDAHVLKGGLSNVPLEEYAPALRPESETAEVIDINRDKLAAVDNPAVSVELEKIRTEKNQLEKNVRELGVEIDSLKGQIEKSEASIARSESELTQSQQILQQEQENVKSLEEELDALRDTEIKSDRLQEELSKAKAQTEEQNKLLLNAQQSDESAQKKLLSLQANIDRLEKDLKISVARASEAEDVHESNIHEFESVHAELDSLRSEKTSLTEKLDSIEREKEALGKDVEASVSALNGEIGTLRLSLSELQQSKASVENELKAVVVRASEAEDVRETNLNELESVRAELDSLRSEKTSLTEKLDSIEREKEALGKDVDASVSALNAEIGTLRLSLSELQQSKASVDNELKAEKNQLESVHKELLERKEEQQTLDGQISKLNGELETEQKRYLGLETEKSAIENELAGLRESLNQNNSTSEQQHAELQKQIQDSKQARIELEQKLEASLTQVSELEDSLHALKQGHEDSINGKDLEVQALTSHLNDAVTGRLKVEAEVNGLIEKIEIYETSLAEIKESSQQEANAALEKIKSLEVALAKAGEDKSVREAALQSQLDEYQERHQTLEVEISDLKAKTTQNEAMLVSEKEINEQKNKESQEAINSLNAELQKVTQEKTEQESGLLSQLNASENTRQELQKEIAVLASKIEESEARLTSEKESVQLQHQQSLDRINALESELQNAGERSAALELSIQTLEENGRQSRQDSEQRSIEKQNLEAELKALNNELEGLRIAQNESGADIDGQIREYQLKIEQAGNERRAAEEQLQLAQVRVNELTEINRQLESDNEKESLQGELQALRDSLNDAEQKFLDNNRQLSESLHESEESRKELAVLRAVYVQKESDVTRLQNELANANHKITEFQQHDADSVKDKQTVEEDLNLIRQEYEQAVRESSEKIENLEKALQDKEKLLNEQNGKADDANSLRSDAESAFKVMEDEVEKIRQESDEYQHTLQDSRQQLETLQFELDKLRVEQKNWRITEEDVAKTTDLDMSQARINELESELQQSNKEIEQARASMAALEAGVVEDKKKTTMENNLQGQIEQLKSEMETRIERYKTELDDESGKLRRENESLREELQSAYRDQEVAIQTGRPVENIKSPVKTDREDDVVQRDHAALFDLPDIDKNLFSANTVRVAPKSNMLMILGIALLFSLISAGGVYWYFVAGNGGRVNPGPVSVTQSSTASDDVKSTQPLSASSQARVVDNNVSKKSLLNLTKAATSKKASPAVVLGQLKPIRVFSDFLNSGGSGPVMVGVPGGIYNMGSPANSTYFEERPQHTVSMRKYSISKYEVSFDEYDLFAGETGRPRPSDNGWGRGKRPVINVTWDDAVAFAQWLSVQTGHEYRLPSEAEWEYAARAGTREKYWWGAEPESNRANCFNCGSQWDRVGTAPVGSFSASSLGVHDMTGNVMEWVLDCYHANYDGAPIDGAVWSNDACVSRVVRGGSYRSTADNIRVTKRTEFTQDTAVDQIGFRVVRVE